MQGASKQLLTELQMLPTQLLSDLQPPTDSQPSNYQLPFTYRLRSFFCRLWGGCVELLAWRPKSRLKGWWSKYLNEIGIKILANFFRQFLLQSIFKQKQKGGLVETVKLHSIHLKEINTVLKQDPSHCLKATVNYSRKHLYYL